MSLAEEARQRLLSDGERYSGVAVTVCAGCRAPAYEDPEDPDGPGDIDHRAGCRIALTERIVAALEAVERLSVIVLAEQYHHREDVRPMGVGTGTYSWCPTCDDAWPCRWSVAIEANDVLVAALKGEEVPA